MNSARFVTGVIAAALAASSPLAHAQPPDQGGPARQPTLTISAVGEVHAAPDTVRISIGVSSQAPTAIASSRANAAQMAQVMTALRKEGVADADIQTTQVSLNPDYAYAANQPPKLNGYKADNEVTATVRDLSKLGIVIDAVSSAGANQINGVSFALKDPQASEDEARRRAAKALQAKAELYAAASGYRAARLISLREGFEAPSPQPTPMTVAATARAFAPTPVSPGELDVRIEVQGTYELTK